MRKLSGHRISVWLFSGCTGKSYDLPGLMVKIWQVGMMLRGMGFRNTTPIYLAAGKIYREGESMEPLRRMFPFLETKQSLLTPEEFAPFKVCINPSSLKLLTKRNVWWALISHEGREANSRLSLACFVVVIICAHSGTYTILFIVALSLSH